MGNPRGIGKNTKSIFQGYKNPEFYEKRILQVFDTDEKKEAAQSNGCLMRAAPLALVDDPRIPEIDCSITNPSTVAVQCVKIYWECLRFFPGRSTRTCTTLGHTKSYRNRRRCQGAPH